MKNNLMDSLIRIAEMLVVGVLSCALTFFVSLKLLENDLSKMRIDFTAHEKMNADYRERIAKEKAEDDAKWDARISRIENCFIVRNCGLNK